MKRKQFYIFLILLGFCVPGHTTLRFSNFIQIITNLTQETSSDYDQMKINLQNALRAISNLSDDYNYVKTTIMPEIEAKRKELAPHMPSREETGTDPELIDELFRKWYTLYPNESTIYIDYLRQYVRNYNRIN